MPCTTLSNHRAGQPWVKPGHDDEQRNDLPKKQPLIELATTVPDSLGPSQSIGLPPVTGMTAPVM